MVTEGDPKESMSSSYVEGEAATSTPFDWLIQDHARKSKYNHWEGCLWFPRRKPSEHSASAWAQRKTAQKPNYPYALQNDIFDDLVPRALIINWSTMHESTSFTPTPMIFRRELHLPLGLQFPLQSPLLSIPISCVPVSTLAFSIVIGPLSWFLLFLSVYPLGQRWPYLSFVLTEVPLDPSLGRSVTIHQQYAT